jgi:hypothetical protein
MKFVVDLGWDIDDEGTLAFEEGSQRVVMSLGGYGAISDCGDPAKWLYIWNSPLEERECAPLDLGVSYNTADQDFVLVNENGTIYFWPVEKDTVPLIDGDEGRQVDLDQLRKAGAKPQKVNVRF